MDSKPFFTFNILEFQDHQVNELKKFTKSAFSLNDILTTASTLKYTGAIKKILEEELENPSEEFVKFFTLKIFDGRLTKSVIEKFTAIVQEARKQFVNEKIDERLKSALSANESSIDEVSPKEIDEHVEDNDGIITTEEEIEGFNIVKAILREMIDVKRVTMRDTKGYCGILLDDNNRKPLCRLHFNSSRKYIGIFSQKKEHRLEVDSVDEIFNYAEQIKSVVVEYDDGYISPEVKLEIHANKHEMM